MLLILALFLILQSSNQISAKHHHHHDDHDASLSRKTVKFDDLFPKDRKSWSSPTCNFSLLSDDQWQALNDTVNRAIHNHVKTIFLIALSPILSIEKLKSATLIGESSEIEDLKLSAKKLFSKIIVDRNVEKKLQENFRQLACDFLKEKSDKVQDLETLVFAHQLTVTLSLNAELVKDLKPQICGSILSHQGVEIVKRLYYTAGAPYSDNTCRVVDQYLNLLAENSSLPCDYAYNIFGTLLTVVQNPDQNVVVEDRGLKLASGILSLIFDQDSDNEVPAKKENFRLVAPSAHLKKVLLEDVDGASFGKPLPTMPLNICSAKEMEQALIQAKQTLAKHGISKRETSKQEAKGFEDLPNGWTPLPLEKICNIIWDKKPMKV